MAGRVTAETVSSKKSRANPSEKAQQAKREGDKKRGKTRVNIGEAFTRWRKLREAKGFKTDLQLAVFLLDHYEKWTSTSTSYEDEMSRPPSPVSSVASQSLCFSYEKDEYQDVTFKPSEESSNDSQSSSEREDFPMEEEEDLERSALSAVEEVEVSVDWEDKTSSADEDTDDSASLEEGVTEELDSDDPDYTPGGCVRKGKMDNKIPKKLHLQTTKEETSSYVGELQVSVLETRLSSDAADADDEHVHSSNEQLQEGFSEETKRHEWPRKPKKTFECLTCGRVFPRNSALKRHLVIHSGKKPFKCFICGRGFTQDGNLKTHMKVHKGESSNWALVKEKSPPKESPVTVHVCGECGMDFPQKEQLEEHRESHKKPYACPECGKTFTSIKSLKVHERKHTGDSPFICSDCGKSFLTKGTLERHKLTHTGEKNFHCDQCGRAFLHASNLNIHLKTHSGERPHLCAICGKSYSRVGTLKDHLRVHTGEKPYTCERCGKSFYYYQGFRVHRMMHDKKPKPPTKPLGRPKQRSGR